MDFNGFNLQPRTQVGIIGLVISTLLFVFVVVPLSVAEVQKTRVAGATAAKPINRANRSARLVLFAIAIASIALII